MIWCGHKNHAKQLKDKDDDPVKLQITEILFLFRCVFTAISPRPNRYQHSQGH